MPKKLTWSRSLDSLYLLPSNFSSLLYGLPCSAPQAGVYEQLQPSFVAFWLPFEFRPEDVPVVARGWEGLPAGLRTGLTPLIEVYFHIAGRTSLLIALQQQSPLRSGNLFLPWPVKPAPVPPEVLLRLPIQTFVDSPFLFSLFNFFPFMPSVFCGDPDWELKEKELPL